MSLARSYNRLFKRSLLHYAAWSPLTDAYEVGDYGGFRRGVFQKLGNVREFGVDPKPRPSGATVRFSFTSTGAVVVRTAAGATVDTFAADATQAKLDLSFQGNEGFFIRTKDLTVMEMPSVDAVARQLFRKRDDSGRKWRLGWRVVRKVYVADDPAIFASSERQASFSLTGNSALLQQLELGNASADVAVSSSQASSLEIIGGKGPIALDLFRVPTLGRAGLESFAPGDGAGDEGEPELDDDWDEDLEDDPDDLFA